MRTRHFHALTWIPLLIALSGCSGADDTKTGDTPTTADAETNDASQVDAAKAADGSADAVGSADTNATQDSQQGRGSAQDAAGTADAGQPVDGGAVKSEFAGVWQQVDTTYETFLRIADDGKLYMCVFDEKSGGTYTNISEFGTAKLSADGKTLTVQSTEKGETFTDTFKKVADSDYPQCCKTFEQDNTKMCPLKKS